MSAERSESSLAAGRVPVVLLSGHLGAGKTSLLNHLLREPGARIGVVINDFGALNVDAALVTGQIDAAATISGGCLCCLPDAGGLDESLRRLSQPKLRLDAILIEASGVADPVALARIIRFSDAGNVRLAGIVEVIDAIEHFETVDTEPIPPARYAVTTLAVIGKTDLVPEAQRDAVIGRIADRIRQRNPDVYVVAANRGRIDPTLVFDTATNEDPLDELPIAQLLREAALDETNSDPHNSSAHEHATARSVELTNAVSPTALVDFLENPPAGAYRIKGRVRVRGPRSERGYIVHVVGRSVHVERVREAPDSGELVVIGVGLDAAETDSRFATIAGAANETTDGTGRLERHADRDGLDRLDRYCRLSQ